MSEVIIPLVTCPHCGTGQHTTEQRLVRCVSCGETFPRTQDERLVEKDTEAA